MTMIFTYVVFAVIAFAAIAILQAYKKRMVALN
jgi:hypothetical protein